DPRLPRRRAGRAGAGDRRHLPPCHADGGVLAGRRRVLRQEQPGMGAPHRRAPAFRPAHRALARERGDRAGGQGGGASGARRVGGDGATARAGGPVALGAAGGAVAGGAVHPDAAEPV
ncbi:MAG: hypothetical protein AVDCRST_MAG39-327, partial [uncultured Sphingomonadaceae bacterium]